MRVGQNSKGIRMEHWAGGIFCQWTTSTCLAFGSFGATSAQKILQFFFMQLRSRSLIFLHFPGVSEKVFYKKLHNWKEQLRIVSRKGYFMDHCGTTTFQPTSHFKMTDRLTQSPHCDAQHCSVLAYPLQKFLCWKFRNFIFRNKPLVYLLFQLTA